MVRDQLGLVLPFDVVGREEDRQLLGGESGRGRLQGFVVQKRQTERWSKRFQLETLKLFCEFRLRKKQACRTVYVCVE